IRQAEFTARQRRRSKIDSDARLGRALMRLSGCVFRGKTRLAQQRRSKPATADPRSMGKPSLPIPHCKTEEKPGDKNGRFGKKVGNIFAGGCLTQRLDKLGCLGCWMPDGLALSGFI